MRDYYINTTIICYACSFYDDCSCAECRNAKCHFAECRGTGGERSRLFEEDAVLVAEKGEKVREVERGRERRENERGGDRGRGRGRESDGCLGTICYLVWYNINECRILAIMLSVAILSAVVLNVMAPIRRVIFLGT